MSGLLSPDPRLRELTDLGLIAAGALLHTYVSGTPSTPLTTYNNVDLAVGHENANPIVASAGGLFGPIYLTPGVAYKYVLTDALGNFLWQQDPISVEALGAASLTNHGVVLGTGTTALASTSAGTAGQVLTSNGAAADPTFQTLGVDNGLNGFRLSVESGVPVSVTDQLAKTTLYCTPAGIGNRIALYDAAGVATIYATAQFSIAVPATTAQVYSVFAYNNAGVPTLELAAWTNDTTPGTAAYSLSTTTGTRTKTGDLTRRFVGLMRTTAVAGQTEDSLAKRYVWSQDNRARRLIRVLEATDSWTYATNTYRQANAAAANQLDVVIGVAEVQLHAEVLASGSAAGISGWVGIGEDSTTTVKAGCVNNAALSAAGAYVPFVAVLDVYPPIGRHTYVWLEKASGATMTFYGDEGGAGEQSGITGWVEG